MIIAPLNDRRCLSQVHDSARTLVSDSRTAEYIARLAGTPELRAHLRSLPQRNDMGTRADGPKIQCNVAQRLRVYSTDPNCLERTRDYLSASERLDPDTQRSSATIRVDGGLHTFPVELGDDDVWRPVVLDPQPRPFSRNVHTAALDEIAQRNGAGALLEKDLLSWFRATAVSAARTPSESIDARRHLAALDRGLRRRRPFPQRAAATLYGLAARDAALWPDGLYALALVRAALRQLWLRYALAELPTALQRVRPLYEPATRSALHRAGGPRGVRLFHALDRALSVRPPYTGLARLALH